MSQWGTLREADMDNVDGAVRAFITDPVLQKRLAKYLVQRCFRNSALEDLHAGTAPDSTARRLFRRGGRHPVRRDSLAAAFTIRRWRDEVSHDRRRAEGLRLHSRAVRRRAWR